MGGEFPHNAKDLLLTGQRLSEKRHREAESAAVAQSQSRDPLRHEILKAIECHEFGSQNVMDFMKIKGITRRAVVAVEYKIPGCHAIVGRVDMGDDGDWVIGPDAWIVDGQTYPTFSEAVLAAKL